ncbi:MAG: hypothetical protein IPJ35_05470 [Elusimicrobia bacterium]|nr:hypothetical protein [Elusimicrobiota bacterium]
MKNPHVERVTSHVGAAAPYNFNGLVRHYFLRLAPHQADLLVNLTHKKDRSAQSHAIASALRPEVQTVADRYGARVQVAEVAARAAGAQRWCLKSTVLTTTDATNSPGTCRFYLRTAEGVVDVDTWCPPPNPSGPWPSIGSRRP